MGRAPCCDKAKVKKGPWSPEEDAKLKSHIQIHGTGGNWISLPNKIGLKRCGKSCRLRWLNYLRPNLKHGGFTQDEDNLICTLYLTIGTRWSVIAAQLPGRTDNDIKNYWNTKLKKKLFANQRSSAPSPPPPPPPPPPSVSLNNIYGSYNYNYVMEAGGQVQWENSVVPSPVEMGMYDAAPLTTATSSSSSSSIENLSWEDINSLQFPHATNYQPWLLLDEPRLLGYSQ